MPDYQLGKIYKIVDNTNSNVYIGSTCSPTLKQRLSGHISDYKRYLKGKCNYVTSFDIIKNNDYEILLEESFPCDYKDELLARERYWCKKIKCVNKNKPGLINELGQVEYNKQYNKQYYVENQEQINEKNKQYYVEHQDHLKEKVKQYQKDHREQIRRYKNTKCDCKCGGKYTLACKSNHVKTSKHIEYVKSETIKQCLFKNLSYDEIYQIYKTV